MFASARNNMLLALRCYLALLLACAMTVAADNEVQLNSTIAKEKQSSNGTVSGTDDDKGFWEWLAGLVGPPASQAPLEPEKCSKCTCGLTNKHNRIVGGVETQVNQYPWMALLMYKGQFYCGGSIINSRFVMTAAHCIDRFDISRMSVRVFEHDWSVNNETKMQEFRVERTIKHSGYSTTNYNNDIGLVKLKNSIVFEGPLRPVCLPDRTKTFAGEKGIVTGWGAVKESGMVSHTLQEVVVPILTNAECRATKYPSRRITDNMLCAGYEEGGKDSCQGDSGGPLHVENNNVHQIVGVVSWGEGCAKPGYPGVYSRVNRFLTWIAQNTQEGCYC
ncbi:trypsin-1-like [Pseudomyrmex gracilis]|uniref:trypsin-1-like n=1 Tax=Pseudomyrmex gracilis TaxID=219809 RepID=UPI00099598E5|nr:trypsin-1-like [Pseudomyrmex gracilis]